jgi:aminoglycoside phosphotransferase (APT) family kinase protein
MTVSDADVAEMVRACRPEWRVQAFERAAEGTDFVAFVDCVTPDGPRRAVLKATTAGFVRPEVARAEPRLYDILCRETSIPVPEVYGAVDAHEAFPAPFYLLEHVDGTNVEADPGALSPAARERTCREAGRNLAELHELRTFPRVGSVGIRDGLTVVPGEEGLFKDGREWFRAAAQRSVEALAEGTYFPDRAEQPDRFADLAAPLAEAFEERIAAMPDPAPPRFCHWDYRYGNLLLDPETGATRAVLDFANCSTADPAYNLACAEYHLLGVDDEAATVARHRAVLREAYAAGRDAWTFDEAVEARLQTYALKCRVDAMACLPLWHEEKSSTGKDSVERAHREAVAAYL